MACSTRRSSLTANFSTAAGFKETSKRHALAVARRHVAQPDIGVRVGMCGVYAPGMVMAQRRWNVALVGALLLIHMRHSIT